MATPRQPLPNMTHAEVLRRMQLEIEEAGSQAAAARNWQVSPALVAFVMNQERNIGTKLLKALGLRRVTLVVHRYAPAKIGVKRTQIVRKLARGSPYASRIDPE